MPNLYITPAEIKAAAPDNIRAGTIKYDAPYLRLANVVSRAIDNHCHRTFFPQQGVRYFDGTGTVKLWIPDLLSITEVAYSTDGETYTALTEEDDYYPTAAGDYNLHSSFSLLLVSALSDRLACWGKYRRAVRISGVWAYADDRLGAWEDSTDTVEDNPLAVGATTITVNDADGADLFGLTPRFAAGGLAKIGTEIVEITGVDTSTNTLTVVRGRNGTTAAQHAQNAAIYTWKAPEPVKQAAIIQCVRQLERAGQGYGEARANAEIGQMFWIKSLDPEAGMLLQNYVLLDW
jgi:hypothetical protein